MTKTLLPQIFSSKMSRKGVSEHFDHITEQVVDTSYTTSSEQVRAAVFQNYLIMRIKDDF